MHAPSTNEELVVARRELQLLQDADAVKDRFIAVLSHELRNPLASIESAADLMTADGASEEDVRQAARIVQRQARMMKALLNDLLDVSRLKLGRFELQRHRVRLSVIVAGALEVTQPLLATAGHRLTIDLPPYEVELDADALRLGQALSNLLANAIRYTPREGRIGLRAHVVGGKLELIVSDTGRGFEAEQIDEMFAMFAQGPAVPPGGLGLGIGLALVKNIVELHGGEVFAASAGPGCGSEFRAVIPHARVVEAAASFASGRASHRDANRGLVLIADDNEDAAWGIAKLLELAGFEALRTSNGAQALEAMALRGPDAAVIDIDMPDLDGHEVARRARAADWGRGMALVALSGWGRELDVREAANAGFDAHLTKPVDGKRIAVLLDELVAAKRR